MASFKKRAVAGSSVALAFALASLNAVAALAPYTPDANTLHLWHLDEAATPCADLAVGGTNLTSLANGASLGAANPSFAGFGNCLNTFDGGQSSTTQKDALLCPPSNVSRQLPNPPNDGLAAPSHAPLARDVRFVPPTAKSAQGVAASSSFPRRRVSAAGA